MRLIKASFWRSVARGARGALIHVRLSNPRLGKKCLKHRAGFGTLYYLFLKASSKKPNRQVYNILQVFKNYGMGLDPIIDSQEFQPRHTKRISLTELKAIPESKYLASEIAREIKRSRLTTAQKEQIIRIVCEFRRKVIGSIERTMQNPFASKEEVFRGVEETAGRFLGTASEIASICHGLDGENRLRFRTAFENFTNALQIKDDMHDALIDFGVVQNSTIAIAKEYPEEFERLRKRAESKHKGKLSKKWFYANLPKTMQEAERQFEKYVKRIPKERATECIIKACKDAFYGL